MEAFIIIALILAGLLLFIIEVFLIPGISIAGIASACAFCMPTTTPSPHWELERESLRWQPR